MTRYVIIDAESRRQLYVLAQAKLASGFSKIAKQAIDDELFTQIDDFPGLQPDIASLLATSVQGARGEILNEIGNLALWVVSRPDACYPASWFDLHAG